MVKNTLRAALAAFALLALAYSPAIEAQTVTQQPQYTAARAVTDLGNGPLEVKMLQGSMAIFTSQGSGVTASNSSSSTAIVLTATPATPPCVGCVISGTGITSGTTVTATSTTSITLSAAMTVATSVTLSWGAACPAAPPTAPVALIQAAVGADIPMYTQARVCTYGGTGPGGQFLTFAIGAH